MASGAMHTTEAELFAQKELAKLREELKWAKSMSKKKRISSL